MTLGLRPPSGTVRVTRKASDDAQSRRQSSAYQDGVLALHQSSLHHRLVLSQHHISLFKYINSTFALYTIHSISYSPII
jgi:hypothetical protein